ncbi:MAG: FAD-dependent oxidoreductase [Planctomycetota bacterium]|nr:FAD-dependent oxidoreductase [Planctomycetota bacterium]
MQETDILESLPAELLERLRSENAKEFLQSGEFVLYWMRTAIRVDENPALNTAIQLANQLQKPLLVYQGLTERYPFASDRHHSFVLQGAKDVQLAFTEREIQYALHVERDGHRGRHLKTLADRAAVVVTEDMPTEPLRTWTEKLAKIVSCRLVTVDCACVVSMQLVRKSYDRAFAFRDATKKYYAKRVTRRGLDSVLDVEQHKPIQLPFEQVDLQQTAIAHLVQQCSVDHSIGPVAHTRGGSKAGYKRWNEFQTNGLSNYDRRRNNALIDGVSRLSAYLHYGMISPMRIAREATEHGSKGANKFLDELLIWRELAYAFCFYRRDHGRLSAVPAWARETLQSHEVDDRELLSWETMARGQTGDCIWDSAQRSLLIHGELHNNVRMTWGKAILAWTKDSKQALKRIIDLNHRYALDGRDPASFGGILWCLGQFDRPFSPEQPIFGSVRGRSTQEHAKRLNPEAYRKITSRALWKPVPRIAVVGTGLSGLACARTLADHGASVQVFEKSRGLGGRMATRRIEGVGSFDHGAQYFTARDKRFQRYVQSWQEDQVVQTWEGRIVSLRQGQVEAEKSAVQRYVASPGMSSLGKHLASDLPVEFDTRVESVCRKDEKWNASDENGNNLGQFDFVVLAVPSHQASDLLSDAPDLKTQAARIEMRACWGLMLGFEDRLELEFDGAFVQDSPLAWIAKNSSKPGCESQNETWMVHANADWSMEHYEKPESEVSEQLMAEFEAATGLSDLRPIHVSTKRWRYAQPVNPHPDSCLFDETQRIGACGDWCGGPRVEGAFLSGMAIAGRIMGVLDEHFAAPANPPEQLSLF